MALCLAVHSPSLALTHNCCWHYCLDPAATASVGSADTPGFAAENETKPALTHAVEGAIGSTLFTADKVGPSVPTACRASNLPVIGLCC